MKKFNVLKSFSFIKKTVLVINRKNIEKTMASLMEYRLQLYLDLSDEAVQKDFTLDIELLNKGKNTFHLNFYDSSNTIIKTQTYEIDICDDAVCVDMEDYELSFLDSVFDRIEIVNDTNTVKVVIKLSDILDDLAEEARLSEVTLIVKD